MRSRGGPAQIRPQDRIAARVASEPEVRDEAVDQCPSRAAGKEAGGQDNLIGFQYSGGHGQSQAAVGCFGLQAPAFGKADAGIGPGAEVR